jgi:hypothetical protein
MITTVVAVYAAFMILLISSEARSGKKNKKKLKPKKIPIRIKS